MPGRDRLHEIVKESLDQAMQALGDIGTAANYPKGATEGSVRDHACNAHAAVDKAAEAARILVKEGQ